MKKIIAIAICACLFNSCLKDEIPFQYTIRVWVYLADDRNTPIEQVSVTLKYPKNGKTDFISTYNKTDGCHEFSNIEIPGAYQIWAHTSGNIYRDKQQNVTLDENKVLTVHLTLEKF